MTDKNRLRLGGLAGGAAAIAIDVFVGHYLGPARARASAVAFIAVLVALLASWDLRRFISYWVVMTGMVAVHVFLVMLVPWSDAEVPAPGMNAIVFCDLGLIYAAIWLLRRALGPQSNDGGSGK